MEALTSKDLIVIKESLEYTRHKFENYQEFPSYEFKQQRLNDVNETLNKIQKLIIEEK